MTVAVTLIVLFVGLLVSIALHEVGHMVPAKRFGVRVSQYMVGFGPTLWSRQKGETEYGVKAIPAGGYVRLVGMYPPAPAGARRRRRGWAYEVTEAAREASLDEIHPGEEGRAFYQLSAPKKVVVMLGGPVMNLLIAAVLMIVVLCGLGTPNQATTTVGTVGDCVAPVTVTDGEYADTSCSGLPASPAQAAGLQAGDTVVEYAGVPVDGWDDLTGAIADHGTSPTTMVVERAGERVTLDVTPVERTTTIDGKATTAPAIGLTPTTETEHASLGEALSQTWDGVTATAGLVVELPVKVVQVAQQTFGDEPRTADGPVSVVGVGRIAVDVTDQDGTTVLDSVRFGLALLASLNIALFVFNLIPLVPLDGGHVVGALYEGAKRTVARVRHRSLPGPADVARMTPVAYGVFVVLVAMGLLLIYADIVDPVRLT